MAAEMEQSKPGIWLPSRLRREDHLTESEKQLADLRRRTLRCLNKLTPDNSNRLAQQMKALTIVYKDHLDEVVQLLLSKVMNEPKFSSIYSDVSGQLQKMMVFSNEGNITFRKTLLNCCQKHFESGAAENSEILNQLKASTLHKENDMKFALSRGTKSFQRAESLEEAVEDHLRKFLSFVRFTGELYNLHMLTPKIIFGCVTLLANVGSEETLLSMCALVTTVGKNLQKDYPRTEFDAIAERIRLLIDAPGVSVRANRALKNVQWFINKKWASPLLEHFEDIKPRKLSAFGFAAAREDSKRWLDRKKITDKQKKITLKSNPAAAAAAAPGDSGSVKLAQRDDPELVPDEETEQPVEEDRRCVKRMTALLNKITPQSQNLMECQLSTLSIQTEEMLDKFVHLVFTKATNEPLYAGLYARLCFKLQGKKVVKSSVAVSFKEKLLLLCQSSFQKTMNRIVRLTSQLESTEKIIEEDLSERMDGFRNNAAPKHEKTAMQNRAEELVEIQMKDSINLVRFIGELYRLRVVSVKTIDNCLQCLLSPSSLLAREEPFLLCACELLVTAGNLLELESSKEVIDDYFRRLFQFSQNNVATSAYCRAILLNVTDLRARKWSSQWLNHRKDLSPKTLEALNKTAQQQLELPSPSPLPEGLAAEDSNSVNEMTDGVLIKSMRGILNRLSDGNFSKMVARFKALPLNTYHRLCLAASLITYQARCLPLLTRLFAELCAALRTLSAPVWLKNPEGQPDSISAQKKITLKGVLLKEIESLHKAFDRDNFELTIQAKVIKVIESPDEQRRVRSYIIRERKKCNDNMMGLMRFIGELHVQGMICSESIMKHVDSVLVEPSLQDFRLLCVLLLSVGHLLDSGTPKVNDYFHRILEISQLKTCQEVLLNEVLDLRARSWDPACGVNWCGELKALHKECELNMLLDSIEMTKKLYEFHSEWTEFRLRIGPLDIGKGCSQSRELNSLKTTCDPAIKSGCDLLEFFPERVESGDVTVKPVFELKDLCLSQISGQNNQEEVSVIQNSLKIPQQLNKDEATTREQTTALSSMVEQEQELEPVGSESADLSPRTCQQIAIEEERRQVASEGKQDTGKLAQNLDNRWHCVGEGIQDAVREGQDDIKETQGFREQKRDSGEDKQNTGAEMLGKICKVKWQRSKGKRKPGSNEGQPVAAKSKQDTRGGWHDSDEEKQCAGIGLPDTGEGKKYCGDKKKNPGDETQDYAEERQDAGDGPLDCDEEKQDGGTGIPDAGEGKKYHGEAKEVPGDETQDCVESKPDTGDGWHNSDEEKQYADTGSQDVGEGEQYYGEAKEVPGDEAQDYSEERQDVGDGPLDSDEETQDAGTGIHEVGERKKYHGEAKEVPGDEARDYAEERQDAGDGLLDSETQDAGTGIHEVGERKKYHGEKKEVPGLQDYAEQKQYAGDGWLDSDEEKQCAGTGVSDAGEGKKYHGEKKEVRRDDTQDYAAERQDAGDGLLDSETQAPGTGIHDAGERKKYHGDKKEVPGAQDCAEERQYAGDGWLDSNEEKQGAGTLIRDVIRDAGENGGKKEVSVDETQNYDEERQDACDGREGTGEEKQGSGYGTQNAGEEEQVTGKKKQGCGKGIQDACEEKQIFGAELQNAKNGKGRRGKRGSNIKKQGSNKGQPVVGERKDDAGDRLHDSDEEKQGAGKQGFGEMEQDTSEQEKGSGDERRVASEEKRGYGEEKQDRILQSDSFYRDMIAHVSIDAEAGCSSDREQDTRNDPKTDVDESQLSYIDSESDTSTSKDNEDTLDLCSSGILSELMGDSECDTKPNNGEAMEMKEDQARRPMEMIKLNNYPSSLKNLGLKVVDPEDFNVVRRLRILIDSVLISEPDGFDSSRKRRVPKEDAHSGHMDGTSPKTAKTGDDQSRHMDRTSTKTAKNVNPSRNIEVELPELVRGEAAEPCMDQAGCASPRAAGKSAPKVPPHPLDAIPKSWPPSLVPPVTPSCGPTLVEKQHFQLPQHFPSKMANGPLDDGKEETRIRASKDKHIIPVTAANQKLLNLSRKKSKKAAKEQHSSSKVMQPGSVLQHLQKTLQQLPCKSAESGSAPQVQEKKQQLQPSTSKTGESDSAKQRHGNKKQPQNNLSAKQCELRLIQEQMRWMNVKVTVTSAGQMQVAPSDKSLSKASSKKQPVQAKAAQKKPICTQNGQQGQQKIAQQLKTAQGGQHIKQQTFQQPKLAQGGQRSQHKTAQQLRPVQGGQHSQQKSAQQLKLAHNGQRCPQKTAQQPRPSQGAQQGEQKTTQQQIPALGPQNGQQGEHELGKNGIHRKRTKQWARKKFLKAQAAKKLTKCLVRSSTKSTGTGEPNPL